VAIFVVGLGTASLNAGDVRLPLPKKSKYTPVQKLNRDGVAAVEKHEYDKAKKLFYEAYLIDPNDPFTLNNLGYLAELEGDGDRAHRFYQLASEQNSEAVIDKASNELFEGKPVSTVAGNAESKGITINRLNSQAIALLNKERAPEADLVLQKALTLDPRNAFTLNNLGYAKEKEGELDAAYQFYTASANTNSRERVELAINKDWRGKEISVIARDNAKRLNRRLQDGGDIESRVALLNLRGVSAFNRNDRRAAREFIQKAYKLDPTDSFTLNNMGFLAEMDGDRETADYYYGQAREGNSNGARIALATRRELQGKKIGEVAANTDNLVLDKMQSDLAARQQAGGPVMLRKRDNTPIVEPAQPVVPPQQYRVSDANGDLLLPPLPRTDTSQPATRGGIAMPLPDNQQPTTVHQGDNDNGLIMPLPDDQQQTSPQQQNSAPPQNPQQPGQGQIDNGLMMPLPDDQQPGLKPANPQQTMPQQNQQQKQGQTNHGLIMPLPDDQQPAAKPANPTQQNQTPAKAPTENPVIVPLPGDRPVVNQPVAQPTNPPATTTTAPAQAQPPSQSPQGGPGLLLPVPDNHKGPSAPQNQTTPQQNNGGVYSPPPGNNGPAPKPPKKITDTDTAPKKTSGPDPAKPNQSRVNKISDQD
jgi:Flp pilus assembly protein TadD